MNGSYIYPPRPSALITADGLGHFPGSDYLAQVKFNGHCAVLFVDDRNTATLWDRHKTIQKHRKEIDFGVLWSPRGRNVFAGEYLAKNKAGEDGHQFNAHLIIWDILVHEGRPLYGFSVQQRLEILHSSWNWFDAVVKPDGVPERWEALHASSWDGIYLARTFDDDFQGVFEWATTVDLYEGLVLKRREAKLEPGYSAHNNTSWQVKIRKPTKNYRI